MKLIYFLPLFLFSCNSEPKKENTNKTKELNPIYIDTTQKKFPILVTEVNLNTDTTIQHKYVVHTENGIMFYTDIKPNVGDTAFFDNQVYNLTN